MISVQLPSGITVSSENFIFQRPGKEELRAEIDFLNGMLYIWIGLASTHQFTNLLVAYPRIVRNSLNYHHDEYSFYLENKFFDQQNYSWRGQFGFIKSIDGQKIKYLVHSLPFDSFLCRSKIRDSCIAKFQL